MVSLGAGTAVIATALAAAHVAEGRRGSLAPVAAAAATAGVIAITVAVNEPANHRFTGGALTDTETEELLRRWDSWHRIRVALGVLATVAATVAVRDSDSTLPR